MATFPLQNPTYCWLGKKKKKNFKNVSILYIWFVNSYAPMCRLCFDKGFFCVSESLFPFLSIFWWLSAEKGLCWNGSVLWHQGLCIFAIPWASQQTDYICLVVWQSPLGMKLRVTISILECLYFEFWIFCMFLSTLNFNFFHNFNRHNVTKHYMDSSLCCNPYLTRGWLFLRHF